MFRSNYLSSVSIPVDVHSGGCTDVRGWTNQPPMILGSLKQCITQTKYVKTYKP